MPQTLSNYIINPMGKKNAVFSNRDMYKELYTNKFDLVLLRENGRIDYKLYTKDDKYYIHLKVPSEVIRKFYYDVVIEFFTDNEATKPSRNLNNYFFRVYSNDPAFVFTYCKAFLDNDLFIEELSPKMSKKALKQIATERNPKEIIGYVKSIYFAYLWIKNKSLLDKSIFDTYGSKLVWRDLLNNIEHADVKIEKRQKAGEELERQKRKEKEEAKKQQARISRQDVKHLTSVSKAINKTRTTSTISSSKNIRKTKTIKKI